MWCDTGGGQCKVHTVASVCPQAIGTVGWQSSVQMNARVWVPHGA
jgi:hypothetical protein